MYEDNPAEVYEFDSVGEKLDSGRYWCNKCQHGADIDGNGCCVDCAPRRKTKLTNDPKGEVKEEIKDNLIVEVEDEKEEPIEQPVRKSKKSSKRKTKRNSKQPDTTGDVEEWQD